MASLPFPRLSPWVIRLIAVAAGVELLLATVFTTPGVRDALAFHPAAPLARPWTFVTYVFVHAGLLHLLLNSVVLASFGPPVERRMGGGRFLAYFLYCGVGAAAFAAGLDTLYPVAPFIGMSGAVMGVALAYAMLLPDRQVFVFPLPVPIRATTLVVLLAAFDLAGALLRFDGIAHEAHLGGLLFGWLFFRLNAARRRAPERASHLDAVILVTPGVHDHDLRAPHPARRPRNGFPGDREGAELDRLLDKISASGIASLSAEERRFLDQVSHRRQHPD
jgi:membrane associated rhomboid family serine protease